MDLPAVLFDVNSTLIDIETDEGLDEIYSAISRFLTYQGIAVAPGALRDSYFALVQQQLQTSREAHPEFDALRAWEAILERHATPAFRALPEEKHLQLPGFLAQLQRAVSRKRLEVYPDVLSVLDVLRQQRPLGVVSDAQRAYALPELQTTGLAGFFAVVVVSSDYGYRKPDPRVFQHALSALGLRPDQAIYVGNDMYCDIWGAQRAGLRTVFRPTRFGKKEYRDVRPDYTIDRFPQLLDALAYFQHH